MSALVRTVASGLLNGLAIAIQSPLEGVVPRQLPADLAARTLAVSLVVIVCSALVGLGLKGGLISGLVTGLVAGFAGTTAVIVTYLALPDSKALDASLLPLGVAVIGLTIILGSALGRASEQQ